MQLQLSNGTVELRDVETVTRKERNTLLESIDSLPGAQTIKDGKLVASDIDFKTAFASTDKVIAFIVESWTLPLVLPSEDIGVLDELLAIDAVKLEAAANQFVTTVMPDETSVPT